MESLHMSGLSSKVIVKACEKSSGPECFVVEVVLASASVSGSGSGSIATGNIAAPAGCCCLGLSVDPTPANVITTIRARATINTAIPPNASHFSLPQVKVKAKVTILSEACPLALWTSA